MPPLWFPNPPPPPGNYCTVRPYSREQCWHHYLPYLAVKLLKQTPQDYNKCEELENLSPRGGELPYESDGDARRLA